MFLFLIWCCTLTEQRPRSTVQSTHGQLSVPDLQVVESEPRMGADFFCFQRVWRWPFMVAASSQDEKLQWMEDIVETVQFARWARAGLPTNKYLSLKSISGSVDDGLDRSEIGDLRASEGETQRSACNSSVHVAGTALPSALQTIRERWRTSCPATCSGSSRTATAAEALGRLHKLAYTSPLTRPSQDDFPLASLPLLGYTPWTPGHRGISPRTSCSSSSSRTVISGRSSQFTFDRWLEVWVQRTDPLTSSLSNGVH